jgi:DNA-binding MarR family transcriptional regulator
VPTRQPKSHVSPARLGELLGSAWRTFSRQGQARFGEHGLSGARVRLLVSLANEPNVRMIDLAGTLGVSGRAITPLVDALQADDLVVRRVDPADRRAFRLELTTAGAAQVDAIKALQQSVSEEILGVLSADERDQLGHLLATFIKASRPPNDDAWPESDIADGPQ